MSSLPGRYSPFRHLGDIFWKRRPIHLTVFLTRRCNQRCSFCFYLAADSTPGAGSAAGELTLTELEKIAASCPPLLWLAFSGGEIFLRSDLAQVTAAFYRRTKPAIILLPSNGQATDLIVKTTAGIVRDCPKSTVVVKLSLDGPQEVHDRLRGVPGAHAACLRTAAALGQLQERHPNFELGINSVFCPATQESMIATIDLVASLPFIHTHTISLARGDLADKSQLTADLEQYQAACAYLEQKLKNRQAATYRFGGARLKAAQDILQRRYILRTAREQKAQLPCFAGRLNLVITDDGTTYPCESFTPQMVMGNIRNHDGDLNRLLRSEQARRVVAAISRQGCHCTHECYMMTNILFNPATYPALLKEYLQFK
ncbi:SPASM domain-containing protein [Desulfurivibrio sp. D14AmB]|uniref:radical SAM protein n=1 Tax=Desulfurivibrio sp. D14AmB TaxID=3374370 RepID=UPI00376EE15C